MCDGLGVECAKFGEVREILVRSESTFSGAGVALAVHIKGEDRLTSLI